jgi:hypothetical protein
VRDGSKRGNRKYCIYIFRSMATIGYFIKAQRFYRLFTAAKRDAFNLKGDLK